MPAGDLVVSASTDGTVRTWQTSDGKLIQTLDCDGLGTMMASPDGRLVAIAAFEATRTTTTSVWLLGVQDGTRRPLVGQTAQIQATAFSGDGTLVAATGYGPASTVVWRVEDATVIQSFAPKIHDDGEAVGRAIAVSHDGRLLAAAYMPHSNGVHGGQILIWDLTTGNEIQRHSIPSPPNRDKPSAWSLAFNRSGSHLAASTSDDEYGAFVFPVAGGDRVLFGQGSTRHVSFSDDGRSLTVLRWNQGYERWRVAEKTLETRTGGLPTGTGIRVVGVSGDGRTTAVTEDYNGYIVSLWRSPSPS